ncbi:hypothetical protein CHH92_07515 [Bacillus sonorensis]|nr:hypothetical protein [Bacillus sonorensis]PAD60765.1 hypothetical protein CHH92_07515 [Bacillus sonorensis]RHJ11884.1 hypothetical protein DW143_06190 [Bacillus sonorensis]
MVINGGRTAFGPPIPLLQDIVTAEYPPILKLQILIAALGQDVQAFSRETYFYPFLSGKY